MKKTSAIVGLIGAALILAGCHHHNPPAAPTAAPAPSPTGQALPPSGTQAAPRSGVIYTVDATHGTDADHYLVAKPITFTDPQRPAREALEALLAASQSPIPTGTKLIGIKIADGLATLNFSRSPVDELHGEEKQAQALEAIQRTLGQFQNISRIDIEENGQPTHNFGEFDTGGALDVIRPGEKLRNAGGA